MMSMLLKYFLASAFGNHQTVRLTERGFFVPGDHV